MATKRAVRIHIQGVVQGVGFRPFVYGLAQRYNMAGWVRNTSGGVQIEVEGKRTALQNFLKALESEAPPLAHIDRMQSEPFEPPGFSTFEILASEPQPGEYQPISPDVSLCEDCRRELHDPADRRYRYPFINCTNCGPRFTIITDIPYDRPNTTMADFPLCPDCAAEYEDPLDRRFHAQPVACPVCGPHIWLEAPDGGRMEREEALAAARRMLSEGAILAIKGLGGFHLACDASNDESVRRLRECKLRVDKPFALMMYDLPAVEQECDVTPEEINLLTSMERPIVILKRRQDGRVSPAVAPGQETLGVMLPYTPLHELLLEPAEGYPTALVMTSGNLSEEPIATGNEEAHQRLEALVDGFLMHNRPIRTRCDDSVVRCYEAKPYLLRRARGYAPYPIHLAWEGPSVLAAGGELKNTFCLTRGRYAFLSHHIGDMENFETLQAFRDGVEHYQKLFRITPERVAYDLHPDYMATRFARQYADEHGLPAVGVQHHHAHIAACMADHGLEPGAQVIGLSFDGTGYGEDGAIWGGEVLFCGYERAERLFHLAYVPLPGGDQAVRQPWRIALAWLRHAGLDWDADLAPVQVSTAAERDVIERMLESRLNSPLTSSIGRLFDAVSALCGVRGVVNYEAQAAIEFEARLDPEEEGAYRFSVNGDVFDAAPVFAAMVDELRSGVSINRISARFHNGLAHAALELCRRAQANTACRIVALSGGVWQNMALLERTVKLLRAEGFEVLLHRNVPANDGGLALGQAAIAATRQAFDEEQEPIGVNAPVKEV
jgi:hydrogenase maturation protein HypF